MQVGQQVAHLLLVEHAPERGHLAASQADHLAHALVIGRCAAGHERLLENALQAGPVPRPRTIRLVTRGAVAVIDLPPAGLLRIQSQLGIALANLRVAARVQHRRGCQYQDE